MKEPGKLLQPREATMQRASCYRMTTTDGGNLSIREPDGRIWIHGFAAQFSMERPVALPDNDGVPPGGTSVLDAFGSPDVFESTADAVINARHLGPVRPMTGRVITDLNRAFGLKPVPGSTTTTRRTT